MSREDMVHLLVFMTFTLIVLGGIVVRFYGYADCIVTANCNIN